jgi:hypothetical protein
MQRIILISTIGLVLLGATSPTGSAHTASHTGRVNACLRAHGWPHGQLALQRAELRVGHPNGLIRTCGGKDGRASETSGSPRHPVIPAEPYWYDRVARQIVLHRSGTVISVDPHGTQSRYDAQVSGLGLYGQVASSSLRSGRVDRLGTTSGPRFVQASTESAGASQSFDWADAAIGAGFAMLLMVVAGVAATRVRRRGGVAMPS